MSDDQPPLDPGLRTLLVCPICRGDLQDVPGGLRCPIDRVVYPVVDGIPWMVREHAKAEESQTGD